VRRNSQSRRGEPDFGGRLECVLLSGFTMIQTASLAKKKASLDERANL
jgi:hypothetical protein